DSSRRNSGIVAIDCPVPHCWKTSNSKRGGTSISALMFEMTTARLSVFELPRRAPVRGSAFGGCVAGPLVRVVGAITGQPEHQLDCLVVAEALLAGEGAPGVETERDSDSGAQ